MNTLVCKKCGGEHLTIKCGKQQTKSIVENVVDILKQPNPPNVSESRNDNKDFKMVDNRKPRQYNVNFKSNRRDENYKRVYYKAKMSNLPIDMTEEELMELLYEWGQVTRLTLLKYHDGCCAYVEFKNEDQVNYFVEALNKTPFEHIILTVERLLE
jgi:hypothetical protein